MSDLLKKNIHELSEEERLHLKKILARKPKEGWARQFERGQRLDAWGVSCIVHSVSKDRLVLHRVGYEPKKKRHG